MAGFGLISILIISFLLSGLSLLLAVEAVHEWEMTEHLDTHLQSLNLAENGIEYARAVLPGLEINPLLAGLDGRAQNSRSPEWRNPLPLSRAGRIPLDQWSFPVDDGLPFHSGRLLLPSGYLSETGGRFCLRFSNHPSEPPDRDLDGVVIVRSLGVVRSAFPSLVMPQLRNSVSLVEATLRQERTFALPSPLTLFGDTGSFHWEGEAFEISAAGTAAVAIASVADSGLEEQFRNSLTGGQGLRLRGTGDPPSVMDASGQFRADPQLSRAFAPVFWDHLLQHLPEYSDSEWGLLYFPQGGRLQQNFQGIAVARGDFLLEGRIELRGLLLHLGGGTLRLRDEATVRGAVWLSHLETDQAALRSSPIRLSVGGDARLLFDPGEINRALSRFPATLLGWRLLFPEMIL